MDKAAGGDAKRQKNDCVVEVVFRPTGNIVQRLDDLGDDIIVGNAGADIITSGDGDDEIHYDAADTSVDAGAGYDMLSTGDVPGDPTSVDLRTSATPPTITNIEEIDLNEGLDLVIGTKMVFDATANSIQILDVAGAPVGGVFWDLEDGDIFEVTGATTAANNGSYEILSRVDNGSKIMVKSSVKGVSADETDITGVTISSEQFHTSTSHGISFDSSEEGGIPVFDDFRI